MSRGQGEVVTSQRGVEKFSPPPHPATFRDDHLAVIRNMLPEGVVTILDPFAGIGKIHKLRDYGYKTYGIEIEREWADASPYTYVGDATVLKSVLYRTNLPDQYDAIVTSPTFGNRMADSHDAKDGSIRNTYKHKLGRDLTPANTGGMQWGPKYRAWHEAIWYQLSGLSDLFLLNIKDHIRGGEVQRVTDWHVAVLREMGWQVREREEIETRGNRFGENSDARVDHESMILFER